MVADIGLQGQVDLLWQYLCHHAEILAGKLFAAFGDGRGAMGLKVLGEGGNENLPQLIAGASWPPGKSTICPVGSGQF